MSTWKPIETAPRDGTRIIVRRDIDYAERHAICWWSNVYKWWCPVWGSGVFAGATEWMEIPQ